MWKTVDYRPDRKLALHMEDGFELAWWQQKAVNPSHLQI
jgi:hypothetical protein